MKVTTENSRTILEAEQGAFITEAYPTYDRHFYTVKDLSSGEESGDYRDADAAEKAAWEKRYPDGNVVPGRTAATPLFETAGAVFNDRTGYYALNGITDIPEEEMSLIYQNAGRGWGELALPSGIRTNFPPPYKATGWNNSDVISFNGTFHDNQTIEVIRLNDRDVAMYVGTLECAFRRCLKLRSIIGIFNILSKSSSVYRTFEQCPLLEEVRFYALKKSISLADSPKISYSSLSYTIYYSKADEDGIVIYVHPVVMAKLHGINRQDIEYTFVNENTIIEGGYNTYHLDSDDYKVGDYTYVEGMHNGERVWSVGLIEAYTPGVDYPYSIRTLYAGKVAEGVFDPTYFDRKEEWTALLDKAAEKNVSFATV